jgi:UDP-N-acetylmuramoyl-tripeptide--D-alanyl-D-alanine ligase
MALAIESFGDLKSIKKMLVLGDMFELGEFSKKEHEQILNLIAQKDFSDVILVGSDFATADKNNKYKHFKTTADLKQWFNEQNLSNYSILLKGSRGITLEKLLS